MPDVSPSIVDFKTYHLNHYFLDLNDSWIENAADLRGLTEANTKFRLEILSYIADQLKLKNSIDAELLDRKDQLSKNHKKSQKICSTMVKLLEHLKSLGDNLEENNQKIEQLTQNHQENYKGNQSSIYTTTLKDNISQINSHRLDMVWSRAFIETMLQVFGFSPPELKSLIGVIALANGFASYGFYVVRGGADALPAIKHTLPHPKYDERGINVWDRLAFQAEQRYQRIINDLILWAPVNYITFHYWTGPGWLGFAGNLLTAVLLSGDFSLNAYIYRDKIRQFEEMSAKLRTELNDNPFANNYIQQLELAHKKVLENIDFEMKYQISLIVSFVLLWSPFCVSSMFFTVIGAAGCFGLQLFINQRDLYLNYTNETNVHNKEMILFQGLNRFLVQLAIPSMYLLTGLLVMPMMPMISAPVMFAFTTALIGMVVKINDDLLALYKASHQEDNTQAAQHALENDLYKFGSATALTSAIIVGMLRVSLIGLNPTLGLSLGIGLMSYFAFDYVLSFDKADTSASACLAI